ncbi:M60 family metallopeptidase [Enterobacter kobei]|uniref:M60 family metallopeptidase n=1 Tax=Enterobacter kobei TaxID=208224 RepID=UPI001F3ECB2A|nr:M60 family metallopeptidase [Enterobacter kobei]MCF1289113.1 M60 family metallopeptidase [Enterobacter kobei]
MNIFQHGIKKTFSIAALLYVSVSSACYAAETISTNQTMWDEWKNNPGFTEALDELGIDYNNLINLAYASTYDVQNVNNPLFWLNRTLKIYGESEQGRYQIPVSEVHADGRARTTSHGRNSFFLTHTWGVKNESVTLRLGNVPQNVSCYAAIDPNYEGIGSPIKDLVLNANGETTYTFSQDALLVVGCQDQTQKMENIDTFVSVDIVNGGTYHPLFIFGINDRAEWHQQAQATTSSSYHFMFDGRTRFVASQTVSKNSADKNILQTLRQSLLRTITYDKLDGLDGSSWLHQPSRGLLFATYQACCWANGGQGLTGIGGDSSIPETPSWLDWHEYGHHFQMAWSWDSLTEITVNLYSLAACYTTLGDVDIKKCHSNSGLSGFSWDQQAVGTLLKSGHTWDFNTENQFRRATFFGELMTSWPQLYPALGKAYREVNQNDPIRVNSNQKKIDWFTLNASKIADVNLNQYFQQWNIPLSPEAVAAINALNLPQPKKVEKTFTGSLNGSSPITIEVPAEDNTVNVAFVTNTPEAGPTSLVWVENNETPLYAQVVDSRNRSFIVKLRGQTSHGGCSLHSVNSVVNCNSGTSAYLRVAYKAEDNPLLPQGSYTGVLHLIANDWHNTDWTANVNVDLSIVK